MSVKNAAESALVQAGELRSLRLKRVRENSRVWCDRPRSTRAGGLRRKSVPSKGTTEAGGTPAVQWGGYKNRDVCYLGRSILD